MSTAPTAAVIGTRASRLRRIGAAVFLGLTILWIATMLASLRWRFLDRFTAGANHGLIGYDFYAVPRAFINLTHGSSIYLTDLSNYGPYATWYIYHPLLAVAVGSWLAPLPPIVAYGLSVVVSIQLLAVGAWKLSQIFVDPFRRAFVGVCLFCTMPTYLMLWNAQPQVFLTLALCLILGGIVQMRRRPAQAPREARWIQAGLLLSLFSKPAALMLLPALLFTRETRRLLYFPLGLYLVVSLIFLLVPPLNRGGYDGLHWLTVKTASSSPAINFECAPAKTEDHTTNTEIYSLPMLFHRRYGDVPTSLVRLPTAVVLLFSVVPMTLASASDRLRACLLVCIMAVCTHFLGYYIVWEYHYTALLPCIAPVLYLLDQERRGAVRILLLAAFISLLILFIPTPHFIDPDHPSVFMTLSAVQRILPVVTTYLCLAGCLVNVCQRSWVAQAAAAGPPPTARVRRKPSAASRPREVALGLLKRELRAALVPLLCVMAGGLLLWKVVEQTTPDRFNRLVLQWTDQDWLAELTDLTSRPYGDKRRLGTLSAMLANCELQQQNYPAMKRAMDVAREDGVDPLEIWCRAADQFLRNGFFREAVRNYSEALQIDPNYAPAIKGLERARVAAGVR